MSGRVVVLRPRPGADATAAKARDLGLDARVHPLFAAQPMDWTAPEPPGFDALLMTSANAARMAGRKLEAFRALPAYAVGAATAAAMREAGFASVTTGHGDGNAIAAQIAADGHRRVLHLAGMTVAPMDTAGLTITRLPVYRMQGCDPGPALLADATAGAVLLIHSARAGERLALLVPPERRRTLTLVAISQAALAMCGEGWRRVESAAAPRDDDMLALAGRLCE